MLPPSGWAHCIERCRARSEIGLGGEACRDDDPAGRAVCKDGYPGRGNIVGWGVRGTDLGDEGIERCLVRLEGHHAVRIRASAPPSVEW